MQKFTPRPYQERQIKIGLDYFRGKSNTPSVLVAPTGSGKSIIVSEIARQLDGKTIVFCPSLEILQQNYTKLHEFGGTATLYSASVNKRNISDLTYATIGSVKKLGNLFKEYGVKYVIIDECDTVPPKASSMYRQFFADLGIKKVLGLTATPFQLKTLSDINGEQFSQTNILTRQSPKFFTKILDVIQISEMVEGNYWSPLKYELLDFDESTLTLNTLGSEFEPESISKAVKEQGVNNIIYKTCKELLKNPSNRILVFLDTVENSEKMANILNKTRCISALSKKKERAKVVEDFKLGNIQCITNFQTVAIGFDVPELTHVIIGRPTNSVRLYYQMIGRAVRIHPSKPHATIIDLCNNTKRFGYVEDFTIEDVPRYGWGLFNLDNLITGIPMNYEGVVTKELVTNYGLPRFVKRIELKKSSMRMPVGKYSRKLLHHIPIPQLRWILNNFSQYEHGELLDEIRRIMN